MPLHRNARNSELHVPKVHDHTNATTQGGTLGPNTVGQSQLKYNSITNEKISTAANIAENKLNLDYPTAILHTLINGIAYIVGLNASDPYNTIQDAIDAAVDDGVDALIFIKSGIYSIDTSLIIPSNFRIQGSGNGTVIRIANAADIDAFILDNVEGIIIDSLKIDGNKITQTPAAGDGIKMSAATRCHINNLQIINVSNNSINIVANNTYNIISHNILSGAYNTEIVEIVSAGNDNNIYDNNIAI